MKHGKKYADSAKAVDFSKLYESAEAFDLVCKNAKAKFDETIELHIRLPVHCSSRCRCRSPSRCPHWIGPAPGHR